MYEQSRVNVVIPALNEAEALPKVLGAIPAWVDQVVVTDNGSTDATAAVAAAGGAMVVREPRRGYGQACLTALAAMDPCDVVVFLDGDFSDDPAGMGVLVAPIVAGGADMVLGSRVDGAEAGSLTAPQRWGNLLTCRLMQLICRVRHTDLGPFRAIHSAALRRLRMVDTNYGWTIEMQIKAIRAGLRIVEVPVPYRPRIGRSKVSGTFRGVVGAGTKILWTLCRYAFVPPAPPRSARLIVFGRFPIPGRVKTRLISALGAVGAARCQQRMTERIIGAARTAAGDLELEFRHAGGSAGAIRRWLGGDLSARGQGEGDLGQRMARCFRRAFAEGCPRAVLIGTDCPAMTAAIIDEAVAALDDHDLVLTPTDDGGYCLIGMRRLLDVFDGIPWSTRAVLAATLDRARGQGLSVHLTAPTADVDRPEDLDLLPAACRVAGPYVSVVIPALNEADRIAVAVRSARVDGAEVIVVDGGSTDETVERAEDVGAQVIRSARGRGRQMNAGAAAATGDMLLFLHADTVLPDGYVAEVFAAMSDRRAVGGAFQFATDNDSSFMRVIGQVVDIRSEYLGLPYGDQGIFVRRAVFRSLGGFRDLRIAEDLDFVRRLRRIGRLAIVDQPAVTSGRRWVSAGTLKTTLINQIILAACLLGIPPDTLACLRGEGRTPPPVR